MSYVGKNLSGTITRGVGWGGVRQKVYGSPSW